MVQILPQVAREIELPLHKESMHFLLAVIIIKGLVFFDYVRNIVG
jgi:hypothetical protein